SFSFPRMSAGAFDTTSGVLREAWSFDGSDNVPSNTRVNDILARVGWEKIGWQSPCIHLPQGMQIDLGGIGKEYAVDRATAIVLKLTNQPCLINFGGDIRASQTSVDQRGWQVGIESLQNDQTTQRVIRLQQGGLATSGDSHRFLFKNGIRYGHVLSPKTGWPIPDAPRSVTVAADTCTQAGMFATLAMLRGAEAEAFLEQESVQYWCYR
ncbi:MAG: FAD:protein FMN transferase, partial [Woeseiales bacterium]